MFTELREFERPLGGEIVVPDEAPAFCTDVLAQLDYLFLGHPSAVPALTIAGGLLADGTSVSGAGESPCAALVRLAGEAAEQLGLRAVVEGLSPSGDVPLLDWNGVYAGHGARTVLPLTSTDTAGFSEGLAAHTEIASARLHGVLELFERDAAAHWWAGATPAVLLTDAEEAVVEALGARPNRQTRIVDVTCDTGVPVVVAASFDDCGADFCFGAAAGASLVAAIGGALRELGAAEFGQILEQSRGGEDTVEKHGQSADTLTLSVLETQMVAQKISLKTKVNMCNTIAKGEWRGILRRNGIGIVDLGCVGGHFRVIKAVSAELQPGRETYDCPRFQEALLGKTRRTQEPLY